MTKVVEADRHSWGFDLDLECGHYQFHFTTSVKPPELASCLDCQESDGNEPGP